MADDHLANAHQDFRGAQNTTRGRAYEFLMDTPKHILNMLSFVTLCHLAALDKKEYDDLYQRE